MIDRLQLQQISALPIESVAERLGLRVVRHKCLCPFHDDSHPSLTFSVSRNRFKCFVCDAHGGVIDLAMHVLGRNFVDICHWLDSSLSLNPLPSTLISQPTTFNPERYAKYFERPFINQLAGEFLFEQRHLHPRVIQWCRLTSWKEWLQIPYFDIDSKLTGVQWRYLGTDKSQPRFRFPYGSQCHIYNLPVLKRLRPGEELWIAEGCSDCWALLSSGHKAIAIPSATLLKPQDLENLKGLNLHMYPDQDLPGERLYLQLRQILPTLERHQLPVGCKDYSEYYACTERSRSVNVNRKLL